MMYEQAIVQQKMHQIQPEFGATTNVYNPVEDTFGYNNAGTRGYQNAGYQTSSQDHISSNLPPPDLAELATITQRPLRRSASSASQLIGSGLGGGFEGHMDSMYHQQFPMGYSKLQG